jgi:hypothetical protein
VYRAVEPKHSMTDAQALLIPTRRVAGRVPVEITLVGGDDDFTRVLDDDLASGDEHFVERQRRDVGPSSRSQCVSPRLQRPAVPTALTSSLDQRDLAIACAFE